MSGSDALRVALIRLPPPANFAAYHAAVLASLEEQGYLITDRDAYEMLVAAANVALTPGGSHALINGYCPDCLGGCMLGFGAEEVPYVEPAPIVIPAEWAVRSASDASALLTRIQNAAERAAGEP